jgi:cytochrome P450
MAAAVTRPRTFVSERDGPDEWDGEQGVSIVGTDGARHARLRGALNRGFTPGRIAALAPRVRAVARSLAEPLLEAGEGDFVRDFAVPFPVTVIAELLGVDGARRAEFKRWSDAAIAGVFEEVGEDEGRLVGERLRQMADYFDRVIEERRRDPGEDLISELVRAEEEHAVLTATEVKTFVFTLLVAGSVTTTHLLANGMRALLAHPDELARVQAEPALIPSLVEETLRYEAPVALLFRTTTREVELGGVSIPRNSVVAPLFGSANRDETVFEQPDRFDVGRNPRDHLAFGQGIHFCLGAALARLEACSAFASLLPGMRKAVLDQESVTWLSSLVFRGPTRLRLRFGRA